MSGDMIEGLCSDFDLNEAPGQVYKRWKQIGPLDTVQAEHPADEEIQPGICAASSAAGDSVRRCFGMDGASFGTS